MTKNELIHEYLNWAASHMVYATPSDIDNALLLASFDAEASEHTLTAKTIRAVSKHHRQKVHIFIFACVESWRCDGIGDMIDNSYLGEVYEIVATVSK